MSVNVEIISRKGCHLCEMAESEVKEVQREVPFSLMITMIEGQKELEELYSEEVPVILINGKRHDYFRVNRERFRLELQRVLTKP